MPREARDKEERKSRRAERAAVVDGVSATDGAPAAAGGGAAAAEEPVEDESDLDGPECYTVNEEEPSAVSRGEAAAVVPQGAAPPPGESSKGPNVGLMGVAAEKNGANPFLDEDDESFFLADEDGDRPNEADDSLSESRGFSRWFGVGGRRSQQESSEVVSPALSSMPARSPATFTADGCSTVDGTPGRCPGDLSKLDAGSPLAPPAVAPGSSPCRSMASSPAVGPGRSPQIGPSPVVGPRAEEASNVAAMAMGLNLFMRPPVGAPSDAKASAPLAAAMALLAQNAASGGGGAPPTEGPAAATTA